MTKKLRATVHTALQQLPTTNIKDTRNAHGPAVSFEMFGMSWEYGYDSTPKGEYTVAKTLKGILHMMLAKAETRGLDPSRIYQAFKQ